MFQIRDDHRFFHVGREAEGEAEVKFGPHTLFALYGNGTVHHVNDVLGDRHAKTGSLNFTDGAVAFPLERFENMLHKLLAHTNAVVFDTEFIMGIAFRSTGFLCNPHTDGAACARIFYGIAKEV